MCRRKLAPRDIPSLGNEFGDMAGLEVPMHDGLQRRHSDVRLNAQGALAPSVGALSTGLGPPRSPDLRRHSDVSPASLKELERVCIHFFYWFLPALYLALPLYNPTLLLCIKNFTMKYIEIQLHN